MFHRGLRIASFLACAALTGSLCGCREKESRAEQLLGGTRSLDSVELTWQFPGSIPQAFQDAVFPAVNLAVKKALHATVKFAPVAWERYDATMRGLFSSGGTVDLCFTSNWTSDYLTNAAAGNYLALDDLLPRYAPKLTAAVPREKWNAVRVEGKTYAAVNQHVSANTSLIWINRALAEKHRWNVDGVKALADLEPILRDVKANEPSVAPLEMLPAGFFNHLKTYYGFEPLPRPTASRSALAMFLDSDAAPGWIRTADPRPKVVNQYATAEFRDYLSLMADWYGRGYFPKLLSSSLDPTRTLLGRLNGTYAMGFGGVLSFLQSEFELEFLSQYADRFLFHDLSAGVVQSASILDALTALGARSKNPGRALMLLEMVNADDGLLNLLVYGVEGTHYSKSGPGKIKKIQGAATGDLPAPWVYGSLLRAFLVAGQPDDWRQQRARVYASARMSPLLGFTFDPRDVAPEAERCAAVVSRYAAMSGFMTGALDPAVFLPRFLEELEQAGVGRLVAAGQAQVDKWLEGRAKDTGR